jgi:hypothetical protein
MLDRSKLSGALSGIFSNPDGILSRQEAEVLWTNAYHRYAQGAEDVSGDGVVTVNKPGFLSTLSFGEQSASDSARNFDAAFVAYWTGAVFAVGKLIVTPPVVCPNVGGNLIWGSETTSIVTVVAAGVLANLLRPIFQSTNSSATAFSKAQEIARAFHEATTTAVTVLITGLDTTPGPTGPLPITNTCTIR